MPIDITAPVTLASVTITAPVTLGYAGLSAYQSYRNTTLDAPPLSEAAWSALSTAVPPHQHYSADVVDSQFSSADPANVGVLEKLGGAAVIGGDPSGIMGAFQMPVLISSGVHEGRTKFIAPVGSLINPYLQWDPTEIAWKLILEIDEGFGLNQYEWWAHADSPTPDGAYFDANGFGGSTGTPTVSVNPGTARSLSNGIISGTLSIETARQADYLAVLGAQPLFAYTVAADANVVHKSGTESVGGAKTFTSPVIVPGGTVSLPGIAFVGDTNTGAYSPSADTYAIAVGGVSIMQFNSGGACVNNGNMRVTSAGSLTYCSFTKAGDEDTGMLFPATNQLGLVAGGVQQVLLTATTITFASQVELPAAQAATNGTSAMTRDLVRLDALTNDVRQWMMTSQQYVLLAGAALGNGGGGASPGDALFDSGSTAGGLAMLRWSGSNSVGAMLTRSGESDQTVRLSDRRIRIAMKVSIDSGYLSGDGIGRFWSTEAHNKGTAADPSVPGFGWKLTPSGFVLQIKSTGAIVEGAAFTAPTTMYGIFHLVELDYTGSGGNGTLTGKINGVAMSSVSVAAGTMPNTAIVYSSPYFQASNTTTGRARFVVRDIRSLVTTS